MRLNANVPKDSANYTFWEDYKDFLELENWGPEIPKLGFVKQHSSCSKTPKGRPQLEKKKWNKLNNLMHNPKHS